MLESFADEDDVVVRRLKLESAKYQNELIEEEAEEAAAAEAAAAEAAAQVAQAAKEEGTELVVEEPTRDTAPELPADELEALTTLVQDSALATERALLEKATVDQEMMEASSLLAKGRIGAPKSESDPTRERAKDYVNSMLLRLESQLEQTETCVGRGSPPTQKMCFWLFVSSLCGCRCRCGRRRRCCCCCSLPLTLLWHVHVAAGVRGLG